ncbi:MAG: N-acetyltransferase, partial [Mesorhizobium sp.]
MNNKWPHLDYLSWRETCSALHLYLQVAGKYRLAHTPWLNHSWNATFYVTPNGLASSPIPDGPGIEILFDFREHRVVGTCGEGRRASFDLGPSTVAAFHASFVQLISELGGTPTFNGQPNEVPNPIPFAEDHRDRPYDRDAVQRFHNALASVDRVFKTFRTSFLGKSSPVHLFWGALDLAVTRFSGRRAPLHPGGIPALPDHVTQEAYDREVSSAGFWPGGGGIDYPAFYAYAYPTPNGFRGASVRPDAAFWHDGLSEFILPYDA